MTDHWAHKTHMTDEEIRACQMLEWEDLAKELGIKLPRSDAKFTTAFMEKWLKKSGISVKDYLSWVGFPTLRAVHKAYCRDWNSREWAGLVLEDFLVHYGQIQESTKAAS